MFSNEIYLSYRNNNSIENDAEDKQEDILLRRQHLSDDAMEKLRSVVKTKIAGELMISEK